VSTTNTQPSVPRFDHIVIAVLENHSYGQIIGQADAPFLNSLAATGAVLTESYAIGHPSQPNYLALFSGATQGVSDDSCPHTFTGPNLAGELLRAGHTFVGYSEDLPSVGSTECSSGLYARKHNPWVNFSELPATINQPMSGFPSNPALLPTVSFVIPNLDHDMHNGTVAQGDTWLRDQLAGYANWARNHNSLLIITTDEDDSSGANRVTTIVAGAHTRGGQYPQRVDHYGVLRTILDSYQLPSIGAAATSAPITAIWMAGNG
jgi:acid phosphatase